MSDEIGEETYKRLAELVKDAVACSRLTPFETEFLETLEIKIGRFRARTFLSARQMEIVEQIEGKVYA